MALEIKNITDTAFFKQAQAQVKARAQAQKDAAATMASLKAGKLSADDMPDLRPGLNTSEQRLSDLVTISSTAQEKALKGKEVAAHLNFFTAALKIINRS